MIKYKYKYNDKNDHNLMITLLIFIKKGFFYQVV